MIQHTLFKALKAWPMFKRSKEGKGVNYIKPATANASLSEVSLHNYYKNKFVSSIPVAICFLHLPLNLKLAGHNYFQNKSVVCHHFQDEPLTNTL